MSGKQPHAAFCEEYDEDAHISLPETRQVANVAAKRSKTDLRSPELLPDVASDSGYSSRTAATVNSAQSAPAARWSPVPLKIDTTLGKPDAEKARQTSRKERVKGKSARLVREDKMQLNGAHQNAGNSAGSRSSSGIRPRERAQVQHYPGTCWECDQGLYHPPTPIDARPLIDYPYYSAVSTPVHEFPLTPTSPRTPRYPLNVAPGGHVSGSSRPPARTSRSNSHHSNNRPMSFHGVMPDMVGMAYPLASPAPYETGPALYTPAYASFYPQPPPPFYRIPDYIAQPLPAETPREQSDSSTRGRRSRRQSIYGGAAAEFEQPPAGEHGGEHLERRASRERRSRTSGYDCDEDYYRMPPPKSKPAPRIIQKRPELQRKVVTTAFAPSERRSSKAFDMSEVEAALPDYHSRRLSRETIVPERSHSMREGRRNTTYDESGPAARIIEGGRRRRQTLYHYNREDDSKQREAEEYQAARSKPVPLTADALRKAKTPSQRADSDSGSLKSRSNSSRGSNVGSRGGGDQQPIVMTMNGVTMSFTQESAAGKRISVWTGHDGQVEFNIEGRRPKKYLAAGRSDYTSSSGGRRELEDGRRFPEDPRRARDERHTDRASRRSSRSTHASGDFFD